VERFDALGDGGAAAAGDGPVDDAPSFVASTAGDEQLGEHGFGQRAVVLGTQVLGL
jgi:hypothetical protein